MKRTVMLVIASLTVGAALVLGVASAVGGQSSDQPTWQGGTPVSCAPNPPADCNSAGECYRPVNIQNDPRCP